MSERALLFNTYSFDLLKRCKTVAKAEKDTSREARVLLRAIKKHYRTYDAASPEHLERWRAACGGLAEAYLAPDAPPDFLAAEDALAAEWYKDVPFSAIAALQPNLYNQHQYWTIFGLLCRPEVDGAAAVACMRLIGDAPAYQAALAALEPAAVREPLQRLVAVYDATQAEAASSSAPDLGILEDTSLGRLAKEIIEDPSVRELSEGLKGSASLTDMLADGGGNLGKLMSTVSQKMLAKLANGELRQETLLADAVKFAGKLQGMLPGGGAGPLGGMMKDLLGGGGGGGGGGGLDIAGLMGMLGGLGGAGGGGGLNRKQRKRAESMSERLRRKRSASAKKNDEQR